MYLDSKRGVEQPQLIVYVLFTIILTLSGIYVAFTYLGGVNVSFEFQDYASRLNLVTSKMIYSSDCFGVESSYYAPDATKHYQKEIGVVNWTKFNKTRYIPPECVSGGEKQVLAELEFLSTHIKDIAWSCSGSSMDVSFCAAYGQPNDVALRLQWKPSKRNMLVFIQNGTSLSLGRMTVRLKE